MSSVFLGESIGMALSLVVFPGYGHFLYRATSFDFPAMAITALILSSVTLIACRFAVLQATQGRLSDLLVD